MEDNKTKNTKELDEKQLRKEEKARQRRVAKRDALVSLYAVYLSSDKKHAHPLSFFPDYNTALMVIDQYVFFKHFPHYKMWCELHGYKPDRNNGWDVYHNTVLKDEYTNKTDTKFQIVEYLYSADDIASILRSFSGCIPLALPFERKEEYDFHAAAMAGQEETEIERNMTLAAMTMAEMTGDQNYIDMCKRIAEEEAALRKGSKKDDDNDHPACKA